MNLPVGHEQPRECGVFRVSRRGRDGLRTFGACPPLRFGLLRIELASLGSNQTPFRSGLLCARQLCADRHLVAGCERSVRIRSALSARHEKPRIRGAVRIWRRGRDGLRTFGACPPLRFGLLRIELASLGSNQTPFRSGFCVPGNFVLIGTSLPAASVRFESGAPSRPDTKNPAFAGPFVSGGEGGIRTPGRLQTFNGFQDRRIRPLCHLSINLYFNLVAAAASRRAP